MSERWRKIGDMRYEVSDLGRVRSLCGKRGPKIMKPYVDKNGRHAFHLRHNNETIQRFCHVLVAEAFISPRPKGMVTNHIDFNPSNNVPSNLEWVTQGDNVRHSRDAGRMSYKRPWVSLRRGEAHPMRRLSNDDVSRIRARYAADEKMASIARDYPQVRYEAVKKICYGLRWKETA